MNIRTIEKVEVQAWCTPVIPATLEADTGQTVSKKKEK